MKAISKPAKKAMPLKGTKSTASIVGAKQPMPAAGFPSQQATGAYRKAPALLNTLAPAKAMKKAMPKKK